MTKKLHLASVFFALGMLQGMPALGDEIGALPPMQMQNGIPFVTGGFGKDESCAMKAAAGSYDLVLTFAERDGSYVADVNVQIVDTSGDTVLETVSGPLLLVSLPPGEYRVGAEYNGAAKWRTVSVGGSQSDRLTFAWARGFGSERTTSSGAEFSAFEISEPRRVKACP